MTFEEVKRLGWERELIRGLQEDGVLSWRRAKLDILSEMDLESDSRLIQSIVLSNFSKNYL